MKRYIITESGYKRFNKLGERLAQISSESSEWYKVMNELQVLDIYINGETRRMTEASFKPGFVSAFERLLRRGFIASEVV